MASSSSLPEKTITDILSRLPVESLTRFQSVSKNWAHLTSTPAFVAAHLRRSSSNPSFLIRRYNTRSGSDFGIWWVTYPTEDCCVQTFLADVPLLGSVPQYPRIVGSVHGLACLDVSASHASDFVLWNPGTRQFKHLPFPLITSTTNSHIVSVSLGFGFDSSNDDYKLVRIVSLTGSDAPLFPMVEVYSWTEGNWKQIEESFDSAVLCGGDGVSVNGGLCWAAIGTQSLADQKVVVFFDMELEEFNEIPFTPNPQYANMKVMSFLGSLVVVVYPLAFDVNGNNTDRFEVWELVDSEDFGTQKWSLMYAIEKFRMPLVPMATWGDKLIFHYMGDSENEPSLAWHRIDEEEAADRIPIDCVDASFEIWPYVESLVSVNGGG